MVFEGRNAEHERTKVAKRLLCLSDGGLETEFLLR